MPSREQLILLVNSLCEIQDKVMSVKGMPKHIQQPIADKFEPLKAPMFFVWDKLGYGSPTALSPRGINGYWLASFNTSPPDFLSECIQQLRTLEICESASAKIKTCFNFAKREQIMEIPINEYDGGIDLRQSLINFYSELQEMYEI